MMDNLFIKKKRRILGEIMREAELKSSHAWVYIHISHKDELMTYEGSGLVISVNGSGSLELDHTQCREAAKLAAWTAEQGGIVLNGGRNAGVMAASTAAAPKQTIGVIFPELESGANKKGSLVMVNSPQPRNEVLATCAPVVVAYRGGLGTFQVLMRAIVHLRNREYHAEQPPQLLFISNYWIGLLNAMMQLGTLPREFVKQIYFFSSTADVITTLQQIITKK